MGNTVKIQLDLPQDFSLMLDRLLINLKEKGIKKSKAELIILYAEIGFNMERQGNEQQG